MLFSCRIVPFLKAGETILREVVVFSVLLVMLVLMMGSVSASAPATPEVSEVAVAMRPAAISDVIIEPPPFPNSAPGDSVSPDEGKATPILFRNRATSGTENVVIEPPPFPDSVSDVIVPAVQKVREA